MSFGICPVNQFVYSDCDFLFSFSLSALSVMLCVLGFSSYPPFDSAPFVSTPNPPFSVHSLFLTFLSEIAPLPTSIFFLSSPSGLFRLVSQHSFSWFHPNAQPLGCGAPPLLLFQLICYPLASFSHPWPPSLFLWFLLTLCLALFSHSLSQRQLLPFSFSLCTFVEVTSACLWDFSPIP